MGVLEAHFDNYTKNVTMELEAKNFADLGYWLRDLKAKTKKFKIIKIKAKITIIYFDDKTGEKKEYEEEE